MYQFLEQHFRNNVNEGFRQLVGGGIQLDCNQLFLNENDNIEFMIDIMIRFKSLMLLIFTQI
jgi:hypothetical protein